MFLRLKRKYIYPIKWWIAEYHSAKKITDISAKKLQRMRRELVKEAKEGNSQKQMKEAYIALGKIQMIDHILSYVEV